jgi:hypothetical protein
MACWVAAAMHLLLLCNAAAAARAAVALFAATPMPPRLSLAEAGAGDYDDGGTGDKGSQALVGSPIVAGAMNNRLRALTSSFAAAIGKKLDYCIKDTCVLLFLFCWACVVVLQHVVPCHNHNNNILSSVLCLQGDGVESGLRFLQGHHLPHQLHEGDQGYVA